MLRLLYIEEGGKSASGYTFADFYPFLLTNLSKVTLIEKGCGDRERRGDATGEREDGSALN